MQTRLSLRGEAQLQAVQPPPGKEAAGSQERGAGWTEGCVFTRQLHPLTFTPKDESLLRTEQTCFNVDVPAFCSASHVLGRNRSFLSHGRRQSSAPNSSPAARTGLICLELITLKLFSTNLLEWLGRTGNSGLALA